MGYSEVRCGLCHVSFNIARCRRIGEPPSAGWSCSGDGPCIVYGIGDIACTEDDGCRLVLRLGDHRLKTFVPVSLLKSPFLEDESGSEYTPSEEEEKTDTDDVYEYESDEDLIDDLVQECEDLQIDDESAKRSNELLKHIVKPIVDMDVVHKEEELLPLISKRQNEWVDKERGLMHFYEHLAGPTCKHEEGYNGNMITAEDMRGCNMYQCLLRKSNTWCPEPDDQDFERQSNYFLSGISNWMPSTDVNTPKVIPARQGMEEVEVNRYAFAPDECGIPIHPACLDIFLRLSRLRFGNADINGLVYWYFHPLPAELIDSAWWKSDVYRSSDQMWRHLPGLEYLAANPVFVPNLKQILETAIQQGANFDTQTEAFLLTADATRSSQDIFGILPQEIKMEIISYLGSKDIADLRLASRELRRLPISLWRRLLRQEMPWLWEIWSSDPPYPWTAGSAAEMHAFIEKKESLRREFEPLRIVIQEEMPEILSDWMDAEQRVLDSVPDPALRASSDLEGCVYKFPLHTNWYYIYTQITRQWNDLKGLHNRRRIWEETEKILHQIREYRNEGKIRD